METTITIKGCQKHITRYNDQQTFVNEKKALNYLLLMLDKLNYVSAEQPAIKHDAVYDTGDYTVSVEQHN